MRPLDGALQMLRQIQNVGNIWGSLTFFKNVTEIRHNTFVKLNVNDETPGNNPDDVSDKSVQKLNLTCNHTLITSRKQIFSVLIGKFIWVDKHI